MSLTPVDTFKSRTSLSGRFRPDSLKAVDTALEAFNKSGSTANLRALYSKLNAWTGEAGMGWRTHERNSSQAISKLYDQVYARLFNPSSAFSADEQKALLAWQKMRKQAVNALFDGAKLELKSDYDSITRLGMGQVERGLTVLNASSIASGGMAVNKLVKHMVTSQFDAGVSGEIIQFLAKSGLMNKWMAQTAGSVLPFVGLITSGGGAIYNGIRAAYDHYKTMVVDGNRGALDVGSPQAAVDSLRTLIQRDKTAHLTGAAQGAAEFGTRLIATAVDPSGTAQSVVGMASAVASLSFRVFIIGRDFVERKEANTQLANAIGIDQTIFKTHPLLGCYFIARGDAATLISFFGEFGKAGWVADADDKVNQYLKPLREMAVSYIADSRFILMRAGVPYWSIGSNDWDYIEGRWKNMGTGKNKYGAISSEDPTRLIGGPEAFDAHAAALDDMKGAFNRGGR